MHGEKRNAAPGPKLGHTMPVDLPFWLGVSKPFNEVRLKRKKDRVGFVFIYFCLIKPTWQQVQHFPTMGKWTVAEHVRGPCVLQIMEEKTKLRFGSATVRLWLDFVHLKASWSWEEGFLFPQALSWSLCSRVQWTTRKHQWICHYHPSWDKAGWSLLKLQWPKAWTLLLSFPCPR